MAQPYVGEIRMFARQLRAGGMDVLRGAAAAHLRERDAVPADRHDLRRRRREHLRSSRTCAAASRSTRATGFTSARRDRRRGGDHAHGPADPGAHASVPRRRDDRRPDESQRQDNVPANSPNITPYIEPAARREHERRRRVAGRRQPAAHELPALPLHRLHHLAVRHLPDARPRTTWPTPSSPKSASSGSTSPRRGWAFCNGQLLPLSQNTALFSLLGTTYGGDGKSTFALPNLQGSAPMHPGQGPGLSLHDLGETGGSETVTLLQSEIPVHTHSCAARRRTPPT